MQHLMIENWRNKGNSTIHQITYARSGYTPKSTPLISFEKEERTALVYTGDNQTVEDVMNYHYPNKYSILLSERL